MRGGGQYGTGFGEEEGDFLRRDAVAQQSGNKGFEVGGRHFGLHQIFENDAQRVADGFDVAIDVGRCGVEGLLGSRYPLCLFEKRNACGVCLHRMTYD